MRKETFPLFHLLFFLSICLSERSFVFNYLRVQVQLQPLRLLSNAGIWVKSENIPIKGRAHFHEIISLYLSISLSAPLQRLVVFVFHNPCVFLNYSCAYMWLICCSLRVSFQVERALLRHSLPAPPDPPRPLVLFYLFFIPSPPFSFNGVDS